MGTRAGAPSSLQDLRDDRYSLHHVLPYRYPLFVGFLTSVYRDTFVSAGRRASWPSPDDKDLLAAKVAEILKVVSRFGAAQ